MIGHHRHPPDIVVDEVERVASAVELHLRGPVAEFEFELFFDPESCGVDTVERGGLVPVGTALITAVGDRPHLVVLIHHQRRGLDADDQLVDHLVRFGVDLQQPVLIRPAVHVDVFAVLHHLFGRTGFHRHTRAVDVSRNLEPFGIDDENAVVPDLCDIGFFVRQKMDIARGGEVRDAPDFFEGHGVDGKDHMRIIHDDPAQAAVHCHRLCHVAQLLIVGAEEHLVVDLTGLRVVERERGIAVLEIPLVGDEQPVSHLGADCDLPTEIVVPLHTAGENRTTACDDEYKAVHPTA